MLSLCKKWQQWDTRNKALGISEVLIATPFSVSSTMDTSQMPSLYRKRYIPRPGGMKPSCNITATFSTKRISQKEYDVLCVHISVCKRKLFPSSIAMHMSIYRYDLPSLQTQWTFLTLILKQPVTTEPLGPFPFLPDGIFPVPSLSSHRRICSSSILDLIFSFLSP